MIVLLVLSLMVIMGLFFGAMWRMAFPKTKTLHLTMPWKAPAELNNDDRAWLNSQLELAGAGHLEMPVVIRNEPIKVKPRPSGNTRNSDWMRTPYKRPTDAEIKKAAYHLKKLHESKLMKQQTPDLMDWRGKTVTYNVVNDTYRTEGREISGAVYRDLIEGGQQHLL